MLQALIRSTQKVSRMNQVQFRFAGDWIKDRDKAAEKEFLMKEEIEKSKKIKAKVQQGQYDVKLETLHHEEEDFKTMQKDREVLMVI